MSRVSRARVGHPSYAKAGDRRDNPQRVAHRQLLREQLDISAAGAALIDDADAAAQRTTLGLGTAATQPSTAFAAASHTHVGTAVTLSSGDWTQILNGSGITHTQGLADWIDSNLGQSIVSVQATRNGIADSTVTALTLDHHGLAMGTILPLVEPYRTQLVALSCVFIHDTGSDPDDAVLEFYVDGALEHELALDTSGLSFAVNLTRETLSTPVDVPAGESWYMTVSSTSGYSSDLIRATAYLEKVT